MLFWRYIYRDDLSGCIFSKNITRSDQMSTCQTNFFSVVWNDENHTGVSEIICCECAWPFFTTCRIKNGALRGKNLQVNHYHGHLKKRRERTHILCNFYSPCIISRVIHIVYSLNFILFFKITLIFFFYYQYLLFLVSIFF